jgi:cyclopropane-fatty-acyl-phospholipid synthase
MKSRIFTARVQHTRLIPVRHQLQYSLYVYCLDLGELDKLDRSLPLFGYNRFRPASLYDRDYLDDGPGSIREKLLRYLEPGGYADDISSIFLITSARYFYYVFNPVSFYYCFSKKDELVCTVAEVNNTFGEGHVYIPRLVGETANRFPVRFTAPKEFHVSPFNDMSGTYEFIFADIRKELNIRLNLYRDNELVFYAELWGDPLPLTAANQAKILFKHPLLPSLTIPRIYWEAAKLYFLRRLSYHEKPVPISMMTIKRLPPTLLQKRCMRYIMRLLKQNKHGNLRLTLPDNTGQTFGDNQSRSRADMTINDYRFFSRVILGGEIGLGESYMAGEWDSTDPAAVVKILIENRETITDGNFVTTVYSQLRDRILHRVRQNTVIGARHNIRRHYDLSNDFFKTFLDPTMTYSCGLFQSPDDTLEDAQKNKLHAMIRKAQITENDHVLELGCGWGGFAVEAVKKAGCNVTGITVSKAQYDYARDVVRREGLENSVTLLLRDYRTMTGVFDKIVSIEMLEAVGHRNLGTFFRCCDNLLRKGGIIALQTITMPDQRYEGYRKEIDWIRKHIFPGGHLPSLTAICEAMTKHSSLTVEHVENIGPNYARTLLEWRRRFLKNIDMVARMGFDRKFQRKWIYYFACCEALFATRSLGDLQIVLRRPAQM